MCIFCWRVRMGCIEPCELCECLGGKIGEQAALQHRLAGYIL
jgi:hypothetical protein